MTADRQWLVNGTQRSDPKWLEKRACTFFAFYSWRLPAGVVLCPRDLGSAWPCRNVIPYLCVYRSGQITLPGDYYSSWVESAVWFIGLWQQERDLLNFFGSFSSVIGFRLWRNHWSIDLSQLPAEGFFCRMSSFNFRPFCFWSALCWKYLRISSILYEKEMVHFYTDVLWVLHYTFYIGILLSCFTLSWLNFRRNKIWTQS